MATDETETLRRRLNRTQRALTDLLETAEEVADRLDRLEDAVDALEDDGEGEDAADTEAEQMARDALTASDVLAMNSEGRTATEQLAAAYDIDVDDVEDEADLREQLAAARTGADGEGPESKTATDRLAELQEGDD